MRFSGGRIAGDAVLVFEEICDPNTATVDGLFDLKLPGSDGRFFLKPD